jgi:hypothetical protein
MPKVNIPVNEFVPNPKRLLKSKRNNVDATANVKVAMLKAV